MLDYMGRRQLFVSLIIISMGITVQVFGQSKVLTAGFQFKPIFTSDFFDTGPISGSDNDIDFELIQKSGVCFGMVVRKGITNKISFETGINIIKRNFDLNLTDSVQTENSDFSITGYELPLKGLVFIQLSDEIYMDAAMGISLDFFPNDFATEGVIYNQYSAKENWLSPALLANIGWEYRTEKSGYFYIGASFHKPFSNIYYTYILYPDDRLPEAEFQTEVEGTYLTLDLRYFFPSNSGKAKK